ncbi:MAG: hypothetical protein KC983_00655 [Phycisphaerales bacterium]|nr:hypothetical protein [Phycisphaerales bacterium]
MPMLIQIGTMILVTASMIAVGLVVWRLLERQEARHSERDGDRKSD